MNIIKKPEAVSDVVTRDVTPMEVNTDASAYARLGWVIVLAGVLGFVVWASFAPLDKGSPLQGTVTKEGNRKVIQHLQGGIVQDILVKDGDHVKEGQLLVRMNPIQAQSAYESSLAQYIGARASEARLTAELQGKHSVDMPASLQEYKDLPQAREALALQNQLLASRQLALQSDLAAMDESIAGLKLQLTGLEASRESMKSQQVMLKEQIDSLGELSKEGYVARNRFLDVKRSYDQTVGTIAEDTGNIGRTQRQISETQLRKVQRNSEYQKEVRAQLADVGKEADALQGRLTSQKFDVGREDVTSPVDGVVVGSSVFTKGGVVASGAKMLEIVPDEDALVVEGHLAVNLIDRVHVGLPVEINFSAFNANRTPHIPGTVTEVAADRSVEEHTGMPYYKVRVRVSAEGMKRIEAKKLDVVSGMPADLFIKTGERTLMSYLLKPLFDRAHSSMAEE